MNGVRWREYNRQLEEAQSKVYKSSLLVRTRANQINKALQNVEDFERNNYVLLNLVSVKKDDENEV